MRRIIMAALSSATMILSLLVLPISAMADSAGTNCAKELNLEVPSAKDAVLKNPVILVHGLWGDSRSMEALDDSVSSLGVATTYSFDYQNTNVTWVTSSGTDRRLAKTIVCYSKLYDNKKVVVIAHSMGGLLTRAALDWAAYGTFARDVTGYVITIGTPNQGATLGGVTNFVDTTLCNATFVWFGPEAREACGIDEGSKAASAMRPGSPQLAKLPHFPKGIPVKAIAGDVRHMMCTGWGCYEAYDYKSDLVVSIDSATAEYTTMGIGDGKSILKCNNADASHGGDESWCSHTKIHKSQRVQEIVKNSLRMYLDSLKPVELPPYQMYSDFFTRLSVPFLSTWGTSMSEPNSVLSIIDNTTCNGSNADCPGIQIIDLDSPYGRETYSGSVVQATARQLCTRDIAAVNGWLEGKETIMIGGTPAEYYKELHCGSRQSPAEPVSVWFIPKRHLLVITYDTNSDRVDSDIVTAVLNHIEWK